MLVVLMAMSSIGLVVLQIVQIKRAVQVSDNLFNVSVTNAMDNVVAQFVNMKPDEYVSNAERGKVQAFRRFEELNERMLELVSDHKELFYNEKEVRFGVVLQDSAFVRPFVRLGHSDSSILAQYNMLLNARKRLQVSQSKTLNQYARMVVSGDDIFASDFNFALLDSLVRVELIINGVDMMPDIGVMRAADDDFIYLSNEKVKDRLVKSPFKYGFYLGGLPSVEDYYVVLYFSPSDLMLLTNQHIVFTSIILIVIIVVIFLISLRIILYQRKVDEMKTTFISNMTHEVKTPIATIGLTCEMLRDESVSLDADMRRRFLNVIKDETHRMQVLVETILQNAKMSNKNYTIHPAEMDINDTVREVVNSFSVQVEQRGGSIEVSLDADPGTMVADKLHITNLVYNLVDNAVKYSSDKPLVEIATRLEDEWVLLTVRDHGIGIAKEDQRHIFEKFYRVSTGNVHNVKGFGIGLNYVSQVVALHGGSVSVESALGEGTCFTVRLPR